MEGNSFLAGSRLRAWINTQQSQGREYSLSSIHAVLKDNVGSETELLPLFAVIIQKPSFENLTNPNLSLGKVDAITDGLISGLDNLFAAKAIEEAKLFLRGYTGTKGSQLDNHVVCDQKSLDSIDAKDNPLYRSGFPQKLISNNSSSRDDLCDTPSRSNEPYVVNVSTLKDSYSLHQHKYNASRPGDSRRLSDRNVAITLVIIMPALLLVALVTQPPSQSDLKYDYGLSMFQAGSLGAACDSLKIAQNLGYNKPIDPNFMSACEPIR